MADRHFTAFVTGCSTTSKTLPENTMLRRSQPNPPLAAPLFALLRPAEGRRAIDTGLCESWYYPLPSELETHRAKISQALQRTTALSSTTPSHLKRDRRRAHPLSCLTIRGETTPVTDSTAANDHGAMPFILLATSESAGEDDHGGQHEIPVAWLASMGEASHVRDTLPALHHDLMYPSR
ncbi:predicted protein [Uncinocarpus reesii 1704]|uniref:Uncharacterized protein n=1 Tax=Uncinocarpus reesii (strain UAMH 1704) TaxID=336963 RepID=C4JLD6_UNCRE|nr:uncharacterized protein UREG_03644 [Uncinocarpus reesii 1704]EEP78798.1 predicted protein [Uncinocarpus reesii 1704]